MKIQKYITTMWNKTDYCQMASVWEERFKEEAEKTIPLQEVRIRIFWNNLEKFGGFWNNLEEFEEISFVGLLSLEGGHGAAAQEEDGVDRHQDGQDSISVKGALQGGR